MKSHTVIKPIVLIADNSATYRHSLRSFLQLNGYRVKEANSVEQAQRKLKRGVVDLALIDLRLTNDKKPTDNSGLDVAKLAMRLGIPRLIITAYPSVEAVRDALSSRGSDSPRASDLVPKRKGSTGVLAAMRKVKSLDHLVVLHISDLHFGAPAGRVPYYQAEALRKIKEDLQALRQEKRIGRINVIVVSGDTSFRCRREGFNQALEFLRRLCRSLKVRHEQVIIIPGNHDIHRQKANKILKSHSMDKRKDNVLFGKFTPFLNFTKRWYGQPVFSRGKLYKIFDFGRLILIALNSCYAEGNIAFLCKECWRKRKHRHYHGWIDEHQVEQLRVELELLIAERDALCIGVFHHHLRHPKKRSRCKGDHLWDYDERLKFAFKEMGIRLLLHGHGHVADARQEKTPGTFPYVLGSGTLRLSTKPDKDKNQYLILDLSNEGWRALVRKYELPHDDREGEWIADSSIETRGIVDPLPAKLPPLYDSGL